MIKFNLVPLYVKTALYLKIIQIFNRFSRKFTKYIPISYGSYEVATLEQFDWNFKFKKKESILSKNSFLFLNEKHTLSFPEDWNSKNLSKLWLYNLHYFDGLLCPNTHHEIKNELIKKWVCGNNKISGIGWEPYPISLRSVNWIKFLSSNRELINSEILDSLIKQIRFLNNNLEYHLMGNHLLENAKALIFAGFFFRGPEPEKWLKKGIKLLKDQITEQILDDGGHFELSPMYHSIVLEILIDIYRLSSSSNCSQDLVDERSFLRSIILKMANWLSVMLHQDKNISYFNDSSLGIAACPEILLNEVEDLLKIKLKKIPFGITHLENSGYIRLSCSKSTLLFDVAEIGPSYQPGHGHADCLSFEFSIFKKRLIVNSGTSTYENCKRRNFERGTLAHSTLSINKKNSSEVWNSFRVASRANVTLTKIIKNSKFQQITASHNGYKSMKMRPIHSRSIKKTKNSLSITDTVNNNNSYNLESRFHIYPDVEIIYESGNKHGRLKLGNNFISFEIQDCEMIIEDNFYAKGFGLLSKSSTICLNNFNKNSANITFRWD